VARQIRVSTSESRVGAGVIRRVTSVLMDLKLI
jgi:hypothetical protein